MNQYLLLYLIMVILEYDTLVDLVIRERGCFMKRADFTHWIRFDKYSVSFSPS